MPHLSDLERRAALLDQILAEVRHSMWSDTKGGRLPAPLRAPRRPASPLSSREEEVLELFVEGFATSTIARRLFVSTHTVRNHLKNISRKYDVRSQVELRELFARER